MWKYKINSGHKAAITSGLVARAKMAVGVTIGVVLTGALKGVVSGACPSCGIGIRALVSPTKLTSPVRKPFSNLTPLLILLLTLYIAY